MWAAYVALINQQRAERGKSSIGFINPTIYAQNLTAKYATGFHDIINGQGRYAIWRSRDTIWRPDGAAQKPGLINVLAP